MRATVHGRAGEHGIGPRLRTQTDPSPAITLKGCVTGMRTPTEGGPPGVAVGAWPVHPTVSATSTTTASHRQPRGRSIPSSRCEDGSPGYTTSPHKVPPWSRPAGAEPLRDGNRREA